MTLLLYGAFPLLCILAIPRTSGTGAVAERLVSGLALYEVLLFAIGIALGLSHLLTTQAYVLATGCATVPLALQSWRNGFTRPDLKPVTRWFRTRRGAATLLLTAFMTAIYVIQIVFDIRYGTFHHDGLWYHIPRMIFWRYQHSFDAWPTPVWSQIGLPVGADVVLGQKLFLGTGWHGIGYVTALLSVGAVACVFLAALNLGLSRWHSMMTALLFSSFPAIGLRIWTVNSDITAAFPLLAAYIALRRIRETRLGLAVFIILLGLAIACKPTVVFQALLLANIALWQCRQRLFTLRTVALPGLAILLAVAAIFSSLLPVYGAFSDFQGGDGGRMHKVATAAGFSRSVAMTTGHWLVEPLGYLTAIPFLKEQVNGVVKTVYNSFGADFAELPPELQSTPNQDTGRSGLASILFLPALIFGLAPQARLPATLLFLGGFIPLSGFLQFFPWFARYTIVLLAGYALLWGGTGLFRRGRSRWALVALVALNTGLLLGIVGMESTLYAHPDGSRSYGITSELRETIAHTAPGRPLLVITDESQDALLVGPDIDYPLRYLLCPADGDWVREFRTATLTSPWLAVMHRGRRSLCPGPPDWHRPGSPICPETGVPALEGALVSAGWTVYHRTSMVDVWRSP